MRTALTAASLAALPAFAHAAPLTPALVFMDAAPFPKLIMLGLIGAVVATVAICARKLSAGSLAGGSAFVSGVRLGGPLAGALGASYTALCSALGMANVPYEVTLKILAPGFAEAILLLGLGLTFAFGAGVGMMLGDRQPPPAGVGKSGGGPARPGGRPQHRPADRAVAGRARHAGGRADRRPGAQLRGARGAGGRAVLDLHRDGPGADLQARRAVPAHPGAKNLTCPQPCPPPSHRPAGRRCCRAAGHRGSPARCRR